MSEKLLQEMLDYKEIIELKARFARTADEKDWDGYRNVFSTDATFDFGDGKLMNGGATFVDWVATALNDAISLHRFIMPEIAIESATSARGQWVINDYVEWKPDPVTGERRGFKGYGREYETYRKIDGVWKITSWRLRRDRVDPLPRMPLSEGVLRPAELKAMIDPNLQRQ